MADAFETIGWVLSVKDKATSRVDKITRTVSEKINNAGAAVNDLSKRITAWGDARGPLAKGIAFVGRSFVNVIGHGAGEAAAKITSLAGRAAEALVNVVSTPLASVEKAVRALPGVVAAPFVKVKNLFSGVKKFIQKEWKGKNKQYFFGDLFTLAAEGVTGMTKSFSGFTAGVLKGAKAAGGATLAAGWGLVATAWTKMFSPKSALDTKKVAHEFGKIEQRTLGIATIAKGVKALGGFAGVLLGPLAPLLRLFEPLIDMIVDLATPAIETFSAIVKTAFGPFAMILELIAQNLATKIAPLVAPLASFLELAAFELGNIVVEFLKGKNVNAILFEMKPVLTSIFDIFKALAPLLPEVLSLGLELMKGMLKGATELTRLLAPFLKEWLPVVTEFVKDISARVADFFGPKLGKYVKDFKILFIDPITDTILGLWTKVTDFVVDAVTSFGINEDDIRGLTGSIVAAVTSPIETAKKGVNLLIGGFNSLMAADLPLIGQLKNLDIVKGLGLGEIPMLAKGGITRGPAIVGEAGPELALPLKPEVVERTLAPLLPDIKFPALDRLVEIASNIERTLATGTLRVEGMQSARERDNGRNDLAMAPGLAGGGSW